MHYDRHPSVGQTEIQKENLLHNTHIHTHSCHHMGSQPLPGYIEACVLIRGMRRKPKYTDTWALMSMCGAREICMYRTWTDTKVCLLRHALSPRAAYVGTDTGTLTSRKSLPQPGSQAHSAPDLFSERHSQPQREKNPPSGSCTQLSQL